MGLIAATKKGKGTKMIQAMTATVSQEDEEPPTTKLTWAKPDVVVATSRGRQSIKGNGPGTRMNAN